MNQATLIGAALLIYLLWQEKKKQADQAPVQVNSAPNVVVEDDTAEALRDLAKIIIKDAPDKIVMFDFLGKGVDANLFIRPIVEKPPPQGGKMWN